MFIFVSSPSAPLNYSQPEDVQCGCLPLSSLLLPSALLSVSISLFPISSSVSHVTACVRGNEQKFLLASWLIPPSHSVSTHLPSTTHLSSPTPSLTLLLSSLLVPRLPLLAARLEPDASFFFLRGEAASCSYQLLGIAPALPSIPLPPSLSLHRIHDVGVGLTGCFHPLLLFFFLSPQLFNDFALILSSQVER